MIVVVKHGKKHNLEISHSAPEDFLCVQAAALRFTAPYGVNYFMQLLNKAKLTYFNLFCRTFQS